MLFFAPALLALANFVVAQDNNSTSNGTASATDIGLVQANFNNAQLVPGLLQKFNPEGVLDVSFSGSQIEIGQKLAQSDVSTAPSLAILPAAGASDISTNNRYTVIMIDADIVGTNALNTPLTRHWLVNGAGLSDSTPHQVTFDQATTITDYAGPGPAEGSGAHRYTILIYNQPSSFQAPANLSTAGTPLGTMLLNNYVQESGLGNVVAANYFQVENGQATVSVPATSTVNPSAINGVTSTAAVSQTSAPSQTQSGSQRPSGSGASAAASSTGAAKPNRELGWGVTVGAVGVVGAVLGAGMGF
ncbi:phosphatidylethanolamine-binding protein [Papiliotrema laurentii]|uniref:Phosphatidylethanolamine-binding protein n=1 Tax=Papiliotrema laurentii TaxID=5418 RepID=A0AAD9FUG7_PAPLA|nr:phosphatidylethanolamine-binding protein [Papiliotrema laurentii]